MAESRNAIVILGATGDLSRRKLVPALARLHDRGNLCPGSVIVGSGRTPLSEAAFRALFNVSRDFQDRLFYHSGLTGLRKALFSRGPFDRVIFFFALPPSVYAQTAQALAAEGFGRDSSIIIEKPFGSSLETARTLNRDLACCFTEDQIFRIDHYLAKEVVRNILVLRFANSVFSPLWNNRCIESIQISALETRGVGGRAAYFDNAGIIRDMIQNHLMQLLCLIAMEEPVSLSAADIRKRKTDILQTLRVEDCSRLQYRGYHEEPGVRPDSTTETFAEIRFSIGHPRWQGVPVYVRAGKKTSVQGAEIGILFKPLPKSLFNISGRLPSNRIIIKIQPAEGIILDLNTRVPGTNDKTSPTAMDFCYHETFGKGWPDAYEKLLLDALHGDHTLFVDAEESERSWEALAPVLDRGDLGRYEPGTPAPSPLGAPWIDFNRYCRI